MEMVRETSSAFTLCDQPHFSRTRLRMLTFEEAGRQDRAHGHARTSLERLRRQEF